MDRKGICEVGRGEVSGVQSNVPEVVLLFYPIIAMFLGSIWEHNDLRVDGQ